MSLPTASVRRGFAFLNESLAMISFRYTVSRVSFGISIPTAPLPGMGATMRTRKADMLIARSSARLAIFESLMPGAGTYSYMVTTGPGRISRTAPSMPYSLSVFTKRCAFSRSFSGSSGARTAAS